MKETPLSNCERRFLLRAIEERKVNGPEWPGLRGRSGGPAAQTWPSQAPEPLGAAGAFLAPQVFLGSVGFFLQLESPQRLPVPGLPVSPCCGGVVGIHVPAGA